MKKETEVPKQTKAELLEAELAQDKKLIDLLNTEGLKTSGLPMAPDDAIAWLAKF